MPSSCLDVGCRDPVIFSAGDAKVLLLTSCIASCTGSSHFKMLLVILCAFVSTAHVHALAPERGLVQQA